MRALIASIALAVLSTGCSGGGGGSVPLPFTPNSPSSAPVAPTSSTAAKGTIVVSLEIPRPPTAVRTSSSSLRPLFVSPSSASLTLIDTPLDTPNVPASTTTTALTSTTLGCVANPGTLRCTISLPATLGRHQIDASVSDANGTVPYPVATVVARSPNLLAVTLSGVPAAFGLTQSAMLHGGSPASVDLGFVAYDADGNPIVAPHPNSYVATSVTAYPGEQIATSQRFGSVYTFAFSGLSKNFPNSSSFCQVCTQLEQPGALTMAYDGSSPYQADGIRRTTPSHPSRSAWACSLRSSITGSPSRLRHCASRRPRRLRKR